MLIKRETNGYVVLDATTAAVIAGPFNRADYALGIAHSSRGSVRARASGRKAMAKLS